ncbi:MAG TPA: flagellar basal body rod protein FlgB [Firmicutes bacterium]|nr:flagellar basal body rod protein FlgB [Bacillota bacterium]
MHGLWADTAALRLRQTLDMAAEKQRIFAHNLANVNTPHFKRQDVVFAEELERAGAGLPLTRTDKKHLARGQAEEAAYRVVTDKSTTMRPDGNNVDVDREMALLAMNQLHFNAAADVLNRRFGLLRYVITEGRG